ncbi:MAG: GNAT family N-acetyltransferase [Hyphomicrobiaceae bacterium]|nr:MAG: GNAT family N-acetyltransferase [Hyphomicrobiaceae bacterium]
MLPDGYSDVPAGRIAAVVTCLEMLGPAALRSEPPGHDFSLRRVDRPDVDWYRDLYRRVGEPWLWFSRLNLAPERLAGIIQDPNVEICALEAGGGEEGLLELDFRISGQCELAFFGVTMRLLGTGAGRFLMNRAIERAWARPISRFWVHTCTLDHPDALAFYLRSGFVPYKRQIEIAADPRLTGDAPRSAAPHVPLL